MPDQKIFCNAPWYELQIYWDGALGFCCQESHKMYAPEEAARYNIRNISIREWMDSEPMRQARLTMFGERKNSFCSRCYLEESYDVSSRRHRCNQKSVIFTKMNFADSYLQSPGYDKFEKSKQTQGSYNGMPIDLHIDLGNYCNLSCKMCNPQASSTIAVQHIKWGLNDARQYVGTDWTRDEATWTRTLTELAGITNLKNIHFMGGETLITKRFEDFVNFMIEHDRLDLNFSFVTNGTTFNKDLLDKLVKFQRVGIEVSIESLTEHNAYQRQGTDTNLVLKNIDRYLEYCDNNRITLTIRPAISLLTIGSYPTLLEFCLDKNLIIKSLLCYAPRYYDATILPREIKDLYLERYRDFLVKHNLADVDATVDYNESDPHQISRIIKNQVIQCIGVLETDTPADSHHCLADLVKWCRRWDSVHGYDARQLYPEFREILDEHGY